MALRDGDGWVQCQCGSKHWGLHGAAGVVLLDAGSRSVLMQLRAEWTHGGRVWGIPGGARDSHESAIESALREMREELAIDESLVEVVHDNMWTDHDVQDLNLHPGFASNWDEILIAIEEVLART